MNIIQRIIPKGQKNQRPGFSMTPKYITVHQTANKEKGANAEMHARYLLNGGGGRVVGWHFTVDDHSIYQHLPCNESGWHAGDGSGPGNRQSIGIEICENVDGDFQKAVKNAQWLIMKLMTDHGISADRVVPHKHWSGKNCPSTLLLGWQTFKDGLKSGTSKPVDKPAASKPVANTKPASKPTSGKSIDQLADEVIAGKHGSGAQRKKSLGSQYDAVQKRVNEKLLSTNPKAKPAEKSIDQLVKETLAGKHGNGEARKKSLGKNYQAVQDIINGKLTPKNPSNPKGDMKTGSIVDYLKSIGVDSSSANRKKLAAKHGIKNYTGTAAQNTQLLKELRK